MISVLCPSRNRPGLLERSLRSLRETASDPSRLEMWAGIDPDDPVDWLSLDAHCYFAPERFGYMQLHRYYNEMARLATGQWLLLWNDDAVMRTPGWDEIIAGQSPDQLLWLEANHHCTGNLFPCWPKAWSDAMGHVSLSANVDRWLSEIARAVGRERRVPVLVYHERADITGLNMDSTYLEGRALMGDHDHPEFFAPDTVAARRRDTEIISDLVNGDLFDRESS